MAILYRLPGHGWNPDQYLLDHELAGHAKAIRHRFTVTTVDELDYLQALALMHGEPIPVDFDPTDFRRTNVTQLRVLELNP